MKTGVRAHDYGKMEIEKLAETLHGEGYEAAQLAMPKAIVGIENYGDITEDHLERVRRAFERWQVEIPVFGCYMDLGNPDEEIRRYAVDTVKMCLGYTKKVGANVLGTETAYPHLSREERKIWRPYMEDSIKRIVEEAVRLDVKAAVEPVYWHPLEDMETVLDIMEKIGDEEHLRMIFDPVNLLENPETTDQASLWAEWLESTGKYVEAVHVKDFCREADGEYRPVPLGEGVMDYTFLSEWLRANRPDMYLLREEMDPAKAKQDIEFMKRL